MYTLRTRFKREIIAEFLPPLRRRRKKTRRSAGDRVIILCDGMPTVPSKRHLIEFLARKGFWVFHPRYRGSWESRGKFLRKSPHRDILDIIDELPKGFDNLLEWAGGKKKYRLSPAAVYLIGSSFGGPAVILASTDKRVTKAVAFAPVIDWLAQEKSKESVDWIRRDTVASFGRAYRFSVQDWSKLKKGNFYNPMAAAGKIDGSKILIFHAKDDKSVPWHPAKKFATLTGVKLILLKKGGHLSSSNLMRPRFWKRIAVFLKDYRT